MPEDCKINIRKTVRAQICFSDELPDGCPPFELPGGCMMMEIELENLTLLIIRAGAMDRKLFEEWNRYLDRVTTLGIWSRDPSRQGALRALTGLSGG